MKIQQSRRSVLQGAAATGLVLAAPRRAHADDPSGKVVYWHHSTSQEEFTGLAKVVALFQQRYPKVTLQPEAIPNPEFMTKFTAAVVAGSRPDVTMVVAERLSDMLGMNGLVDLTARINAWPGKAGLPAECFKGISADGKIYGIPAYTFIDWVYYRKDWFQAANIDGPPKTLDEFLTAAKKLTDASKNQYGFGMRAGPGGFAYVLDLIEAFGSPLVIDGRNAMDRAKTLAALKWYTELYTVHKVVPPSAPGDGFRQIMEGFKTGQTAMTWHHTGSLVELVRGMKASEFGTAAKPAGPAARIARLTYLFHGMMKKDNEDAAFDWISFWADPDAAITFLNETGYFPVSPTIARDQRITGNPLYNAASETLGFGRLPASFTGVAGWSLNTVQPEFQKILVGQTTPEKATDALMKGLDAAL